MKRVPPAKKRVRDVEPSSSEEDGMDDSNHQLKMLALVNEELQQSWRKKHKAQKAKSVRDFDDETKQELLKAKAAHAAPGGGGGGGGGNPIAMSDIGVKIKHPYQFLRTVHGDLDHRISTYKAEDPAVGWSPFVKDLVDEAVADAREAFAKEECAAMGSTDEVVEISVYVGSSQDVKGAINRNDVHLCRGSDINGKRPIDQSFVRIISDPTFTKKTEDEASRCVESLESSPESKVFSNNLNVATAHSGPTLYFCVTTGTPTKRGQRSAEHNLRLTGMDAYSTGTDAYSTGTSKTQLKSRARIASIVTKLKEAGLAADVMFVGGSKKFKSYIIKHLGRAFWTSNVARDQLNERTYRNVKNAYNSSG